MKEEIGNLGKGADTGKTRLLTKEEAARVSGGTKTTPYMLCTSCNYWRYDADQFTGNGDGPYECPWCHEMSYYKEDGETRRHT